MKKSFVVTFACGFLMISAFTETVFAQESSGARALIPAFTVNGSGTFVFVPYTQDKDGNTAGTNEYAYATLFFMGTTEFYGLNVSLGVSTDQLLSSDDGRPGSLFFPTRGAVITDKDNFGTSLWVKPIRMLKIQAGYFTDFTLAGKFLFSPYWFHHYVTDFLNYNDIFTAFGDDHQNVTVSLTPIENLFIGASVPVTFIPNMDSSTDASAGDVWKKVQAGAGYMIDGIGHIRAQYVGRNETTEVAFALTAVDRLLIDLGGKFAFNDTGRAAIGGDAGIGLGVSFATGGLSINALAYVATGHGDEQDPAFTFNPWISYTFDRIGTVGVDANIYTESGKVAPGLGVFGSPSAEEFGTSFAVFFERTLAPRTGCKLSVAYDTSTEKLSFPVALSVSF
jgi:hypothetical protein